MSIIDRILVGKVIKDFGPIEQQSLGIGKATKSVLLTEQRGKVRFILKTSTWLFPFSANVSYQDFTLEEAYKIRDYINESEQIARLLPPSSYDPDKQAVREWLILAIIGIVIIGLLQNSAQILFTTLFIFALYAMQQWALRNSSELDTQTRLRLTLIAGLAVFIGAMKFALFTWIK